MFSDEERAEKEALLRKMEYDFKEKHIGFMGVVKDEGGDFNPIYQKDLEPIKNLRTDLERDKREKERERERERLEIEKSKPKATFSVDSASDSSSGLPRTDYLSGAYIGLIVCGIVLIPILVITAVVLGIYLITPVLVWLLFIKLWLFPKVFTAFERWVFFVGLSSWVLSMMFVIGYFDNEMFNPVSTGIMVITVLALLIEVLYRIRRKKKYRI